jgi:hypothetical protein
MKLTKKQLKQIIIEELREVRGGDEEKDAILAIVYAMDYIGRFHEGLYPVMIAARDRSYNTRLEYDPFDINVHDVIRVVRSAMSKLRYFIADEGWKYIVDSPEADSMRKAAELDVNSFYHNRQIYDGCLWIVDVINKQTPTSSGMSILGALKVIGFEDAEAWSQLIGFEKRLKNVLNHDKNTQMLFDDYEGDVI